MKTCGTRHKAHGTRHTAHGTRHTAHGTRCHVALGWAAVTAPQGGLRAQMGRIGPWGGSASDPPPSPDGAGWRGPPAGGAPLPLLPPHTPQFPTRGRAAPPGDTAGRSAAPPPGKPGRCATPPSPLPPPYAGFRTDHTARGMLGITVFFASLTLAASYVVPIGVPTLSTCTPLSSPTPACKSAPWRAMRVFMQLNAKATASPAVLLTAAYLFQTHDGERYQFRQATLTLARGAMVGTFVIRAQCDRCW